MQKIGSRLLDVSGSIPFFELDLYKLMAQWLRQVIVTRARWV